MRDLLQTTIKPAGPLVENDTVFESAWKIVRNLGKVLLFPERKLVEYKQRKTASAMIAWLG